MALVALSISMLFVSHIAVVDAHVSFSKRPDGMTRKCDPSNYKASSVGSYVLNEVSQVHLCAMPNILLIVMNTHDVVTCQLQLAADPITVTLQCILKG